MLSVSKLCVSYGSIQSVRSIDVEVPEGQLVAMVGPNGAGKSSTMNAIGGLLKPSGGTVRLDGEVVTGRPAYRLVRKGLAIVPEGRMVAAPLSVAENLQGSRQRDRCSKALFNERLERVFGLFPVLHQRRKQVAGSLSGGEQQMLAVSRALLTMPRVLLLDEPSMGLSPAMVDTVFAAIIEIHKEGQTILLVEQNAELALELCDYALVLRRGEIAAQGTPAELRATEELREAFLG
jgi:branched-chain amino acid transport system ATP-binding protein